MIDEGKTQNNSESETWLHAFLLMAALSFILLAAHFFSGSVFNTSFEVFAFYVPTALLFIMLLFVRRNQSKQN
jgi:hypothetical protein